MSIRDLANAALDAEKAQKEVEAKANWKNHATRAVELVQQLVGLQGKCVWAYRTVPDDNAASKRWGDKAVVKIEDGEEVIFLEVVYESEWVRDAWGGGRSPVVKDPYLIISSPKGESPEAKSFRWYDNDKYKIRSMADLAKALTALDRYIELEDKRKAEREARKVQA